MLTTYANAKAWLGLVTDTDQGLVTRLINEASRVILAYLQRPTPWKASYSDMYDGTGAAVFYLDQWPVTAVSSVVLDGTTVPVMQAPQTASGSGYILSPWNGYPPGEPQKLTYRGGKWCYGKANIAVDYTAGYSVTNEAQTIPGSPYTITVDQTNGNLGQDDGVTFTDGTALTAVTGTPTTGEYNAPTSIPGQYTFAAADTTKGVLISYSYTPFDIEQACLEMVGERYRYKTRIGEKSHGTGGQETTSFDLSGVPDVVKNMLLPYRRRLLF